MRLSPKRHVLAILRVDHLKVSQQRLAEAVRVSMDLIRSVELDRLPLTEKLAMRVASATGVSVRWLLDNNKDAPPTMMSGARFSPYHFENNNDDDTEFMGPILEDYAASFYGQIRDILADAARRGRADTVSREVGLMLKGLRVEFGCTERLMPKGLYKLRPDGSLVLTYEQRDAGIKLMRDYLDRRDREEQRAREIIAKMGTNPPPRGRTGRGKGKGLG